MTPSQRPDWGGSTKPRIHLGIAHGVATITLTGAHKANAIDLAAAGELAAVTARVRDDGTVRAVLVCSRGPIFCAGGDVARFPLDDLPHHLTRVTDRLHPAISRLIRLEAPVIAVIQGPVAGAGLGLVLACDLVVAATSATFTVAYTRVGLSPDAAVSYLLPRRIGEQRTLELALTNRTLSASEAHEWGIVTTVVPDDELHEAGLRLARQLATGSSRAAAETKRLMRRHGSLDDHLADEADTLIRLAPHADAREGLTAFPEKRRPRFSGHLPGPAR